MTMGADSENLKNLVRRGYDALSERYRGDDDSPATYAGWLAELLQRLPPAAALLDLGCGCGIPLDRDLTAAGHQVTGIDISDRQIERARRLVPGASFHRADATTAQFQPSSLDAVIFLYAIIHMPLDEQPGLLFRIAGWLRPGGWLLLTAGQTAWTGSETYWLGGTTPMWWSHAAADDYRAWLHEAGLDVTDQRHNPEGAAAHSLFWARRKPSPPSTDQPLTRSPA
jgi:2-polyprenyl-3-methyl-5-hydroxy-6-metoxy-1,4-benzoquinol methylase